MTNIKRQSAATLVSWVPFIGAMAVLMMLAGCAPPPPRPAIHTSTRFRSFIPSGATGYRPGPNQSIIIGPPFVQEPPVYPAALVQERLPPQRVCLAVEIDAHGKAYRSNPLYAVDACPADGTVPAAFLAAAQAAVAGWRFLPTHLCTFPKGVDAAKQGTDCRAEGATVEDLPIKLAFAFIFAIESGKPRVRTESLHRAPVGEAATSGG